MKKPLLCLVLCLAFLASGARAAAQGDPGTEARIRELEGKLRCLVCQNQTLADSNAELAGDLRIQVREQIAAGRSDGEIIAYMVQRYGDFVLYEPPFKATTFLLWVGPFVLLLGAVGVLVITLRRRRATPEEPALDPDARRLVERVLGPAGPADGDRSPR